jgi:hypothetical protein
MGCITVYYGKKLQTFRDTAIAFRDQVTSALKMDKKFSLKRRNLFPIVQGFAVQKTLQH